MGGKIGPYELNRIYTGDARALAEGIPGGGVVDLILCDPVYWNYMDYRFVACLADRLLKPGGSVLAQAGNVHRLQAEIHMEGFGLTTCPLINEVMTGGGYQDFNTRSVYLDKPYIWKLKPGAKERGWMRTLITGMGKDKSVHEWGDTPAAFMMAIERLTQPGDLVFDPFTGGGTVPAVCKMLGRDYLAFEIDPVTAEKARERVFNTQPPLLLPEPIQAGMF